MLHRLMNDDGADIVEYALLLSIAGTALLLLAPVIDTAMRTWYTLLSQHIYDLWEPPPPA